MTSRARSRVIGVIGASECSDDVAAQAEAVGALIAGAGCVLVTGGRGGVMAAASRGARGAGGLVVGVLPGADGSDANDHLDVAIATGIGEARNAVIANTGDAFVAISGSWGTLSEIALARRRGKRVVALGAWCDDDSILRASTPEEAVRRVLGDAS